MSEVPIRDESIRLGQFLKLANLIDSGADAKAVIADGQVSVNGDVETRLGERIVELAVVAVEVTNRDAVRRILMLEKEAEAGQLGR